MLANASDSFKNIQLSMTNQYIQISYGETTRDVWIFDHNMFDSEV